MPREHPPLISRRGFVLAGAAFWVQDDSGQQVLELFADLGRALAAGDAYDALAFFDKSMAGYARIEADVTALVDQNEVLSSIRVGNMDIDGGAARVETDWLLEIRARQPAGGMVRRQATVAVKLSRLKKKWRITELSPADFFVAPVPGSDKEAVA